MAIRNAYRKRRLGQAPIWGAALLLLIGTATAGSASEVVDLRIGAHPEFTRVVFELDRPAGYRIERASPKPGAWELVVSLDASSIPRKVQSQKSLIGLVRITPEGERSVAHIELAKDGLSLKEMILANPPRIVLDVLSPEPKRTAAAAKPKPKKAAPKKEEKKVAAATPAPAKSTPKPAAKPAPKATASTAAPTPRPIATTRPPAPVPKPVANPTPTKPTATAAATPPMAPGGNPTVVIEQTESGLTARRTDGPGTPGSPLAPTPIGEPSEGGVPTMGMGMEGPPKPVANRPAPKPAADRMAKREPAAPAAVDSGDSGLDMGTIGMGVAGLVVLAGAVFFLRRRSGGAEDVDEGVEIDAGGDDNPFAGLAGGDTSQPVLSNASAEGADGGSGVEFELTGSDDDEKEAAPVDGPIEGDSGAGFAEATTAVSGMDQVAGESGEFQGDEEVMRMIREFERRMASLESRLDEVQDARERLERQVAAQTEELRVQRAAIARTQRAVRNMNRPDEEGPTEPAIREP